MKKIVITLLCTLCLVCGFVVNYVNAEELTSETVVNIKDIDEYNIMGGGTVYKKSADTYYNGNIEDALKRFKRQCARNGVLQEVRKREHYEKPSVKRKKKSEAARKRKF